jgi:hypothetical protein
MTLPKVFPGDGASNSGLSCASQAIEPKYARLIFSANPCSDILENADSSIRKADRVMLSLSRVEGRLGGNG